MEPFPAAATMDSVQPRIVNQVSIEENRTTSAYVQLGADGKKHSFCYFWLKAGGATNSNWDQQICKRQVNADSSSKNSNSKLPCHDRGT